MGRGRVRHGFGAGPADLTVRPPVRRDRPEEKCAMTDDADLAVRNPGSTAVVATHLRRNRADRTSKGRVDGQRSDPASR